MAKTILQLLVLLLVQALNVTTTPQRPPYYYPRLPEQSQYYRYRQRPVSYYLNIDPAQPTPLAGTNEPKAAGIPEVRRGSPPLEVTNQPNEDSEVAETPRRRYSYPWIPPSPRYYYVPSGVQYYPAQAYYPNFVNINDLLVRDKDGAHKTDSSTDPDESLVTTTEDIETTTDPDEDLPTTAEDKDK